jgi:uncharacterized protein (TIGR02996 family)
VVDDDAFIRAILTAPADDLPRLVYADWLDERRGPSSAARSEFLRLTAAGVEANEARLRQLANGLDAAWLAAVSRLSLENCPKARAAAPESQCESLRFHFLCDRRWEDMTPTADQTVRHCNSCRQSVHYSHTIAEAQRHAWHGRCVAVNTGVIRHEGDLEPPRMLAGIVALPAGDRKDD